MQLVARGVWLVGRTAKGKKSATRLPNPQTFPASYLLLATSYRPGHPLTRRSLRITN